MNDQRQFDTATIEKAFCIEYLLDRKTVGEIDVYGGGAILFQFN